MYEHIFKKSLFNLLQDCYVLVFGREACGILALWPGMDPTPPVLEGKVLTTRPPGKSQAYCLEGEMGVNQIITQVICKIATMIRARRAVIETWLGEKAPRELPWGGAALVIWGASWGHQVKRGGKSVAGTGNRGQNQAMTSTSRICRAWCGPLGRGVWASGALWGSVCCASSPASTPDPN